MRVERVDHIAVKVPDLGKARAALESLGFVCDGIEEAAEVGVRLAFLSGAGPEIELAEPLAADSPANRDPDGIHHVALRCADVDQMRSQMLDSGRFEVLGPVRSGAHGRRIFFFRIVGVPALFEFVS